MEFGGFNEAQFDVFEIEGFAERMAALRLLVRPALVELGQDLAGPLSRLAGHELYPRVALHARRRVNPPDDTWVAFGRAERGYKAYAHFAVGITREGIYIGLVLKDEATDKANLGQRLVDNPGWALDFCRKLKGYQLRELNDRDASALTEEELPQIGSALLQRKSSSLHLSRTFSHSDRRLYDPSKVLLLAQQTIKPLLPFYAWAST